MQLKNAIKLFKEVVMGAKITWDRFMEKIGPELLADLKGKTEPR